MGMIKRWIENKMVKWMTSKGGIPSSNVNTEKKTVSLGLYGLEMILLKPHHQYAMYILQKYFGYKFHEIHYVSNWCDPVESRSENFCDMLKEKQRIAERKISETNK